MLGTETGLAGAGAIPTLLVGSSTPKGVGGATGLGAEFMGLVD